MYKNLSINLSISLLLIIKKSKLQMFVIFWLGNNLSKRKLKLTCVFFLFPTESLAQELEMERKSRQQAMERDVKSPLSDRAAYYKNSVLFSSAT